MNFLPPNYFCQLLIPLLCKSFSNNAINKRNSSFEVASLSVDFLTKEVK